jgi:hypothetical protein
MVDQTLQPYAYAGDNPANSSDPTGLFTCWDHHAKRHLIKTGADQAQSGHTRVTMAPRKISVANYLHYPDPLSPWQIGLRKVSRHPIKRFGLREKQVWKIKGTILCNKSTPVTGDCQLEGNSSDGDLTFGLEAGGQSIHCEIPNHACTQGSRWRSRITGGWSDATNFLVNNCDLFDGTCLPRQVWVEGVGFWDTLGHHTDTKPELHPVFRVYPADTSNIA